MDAERTIVAVASPPGASARGIVRTSGPCAWAHVRAILADVGALPARPSRGVFVARLAAPPIPVLIVSMPGPSSATGEECVEIHAPGNPLLLERIVDAVIAASHEGARRAHPGEFSARAVLSGAATLADADRVAHAIAAETDAQLEAARLLQHDAPPRAAAEDAETLAGTLALVEAGIDFTDQEDVVAIARTELERRIEALRGRIRGRLASEQARGLELRVGLGGDRMRHAVGVGECRAQGIKAGPAAGAGGYGGGGCTRRVPIALRAHMNDGGVPHVRPSGAWCIVAAFAAVIAPDDHVRAAQGIRRARLHADIERLGR
ncbi:MAG: hypothetical protein ACKOF7_00060, partial [Phycisphaerales bacterium]